MKKWLKNLRNEDGFTLLEMTIVVVVIALLMIVFLPNITNVNTSVSKTTNKALVQTINAQKILYKAKTGLELESIDKLESDGYITKEQLNAYNKVPESDKK